jgi:hypothetical protein
MLVGPLYQKEERICIVVFPTYMSMDFKKQYGDLTTFSVIRIHGKILAMRVFTSWAMTSYVIFQASYNEGQWFI